MANASRDENHVTTEIAISNTDGVTLFPLRAKADPQHHLLVSNGLAGVDLSGDVDARDDNRVVAFMAVSAVDGITPVPVYIDPATNSLLIRKT